MSALRAQAPVLRLVNGDRAPEAAPWRRRHSERARVRSENLSAARLDPTDARWVLAVRASRELEGGNAAILAPERRRRLVAFALGIGLRAFDANLVIAIVQDAARCGLPALGEMTESRLTMVAEPTRARAGDRRSTAVMLAASVLLAGAMFWGLLAWIG
jgi:hypothetical protein